jgi:hypothetical protein
MAFTHTTRVRVPVREFLFAFFTAVSSIQSCDETVHSLNEPNYPPAVTWNTSSHENTSSRTKSEPTSNPNRPVAWSSIQRVSYLVVHVVYNSTHSMRYSLFETIIHSKVVVEMEPSHDEQVAGTSFCLIGASER